MSDGIEREAWQGLVAAVLRGRETNRGFAARVRNGLNVETEARAYADVVGYAEGKVFLEKPLLRAAAIIAAHPKIAQANRAVPLGASFMEMSRALAKRHQQQFLLDPANPDVIARRLERLPYEDLDEAARTLNRLLTIGDDLRTPVDYFAVARTLVHWGNGISERSQSMRRAILRDYFRNTIPKTSPRNNGPTQ